MDHVLKYTGIFGGVQGLNILLSVVRNKFATHLLGPAGIGLMGIYLAISEFVSSVSNLGIPFSSVRRLSELYECDDPAAINEFVRVIRTWSLWTALLAGFFCIVCSPILCLVFFDGNMSSWWQAALVAPMAMAASVMGGEISILKGLRHLKRVAVISLLSAIVLLCITIPIFWALRTRGILLALDITAVATLCVYLAYTLPIFPWRVSLFSRNIFTEGWEMVRIGIPYVLAAIAGSTTAMAVPALLLYYGSLDDVGFYRAAYTLMVGYAGIVFTALEADYFPRLSSVNNDRIRRNETINQQIQVCVALIGPFMIALAVFMPIALSILFASEFGIIERMTLAAVFYTFFRAISVPISYMALAHGDSGWYLTMEVIYDAVSLCLIVGCYYLWGLFGAGVGLSASALFDLILISTCYFWRYHIRFESHTLIIIAIQTILVACSVAVCLLLPPIIKYIVGCILLALYLWFTFRSLGSDSVIVQKLLTRFQLKSK